MSGIAAVLRRDGAPADEAVLRRVLDRLAHRGPDGERVAAAGPLALGHRHFWTTPEDVGEQQPVSDTSGRWLAAVDGRVDNRDEVIRGLSLSAAEAAALSDAALLLRVFARWGTSGLARVVGSFAAAFWDSAERRLTLARDPLGDRPLCYAVTPEAVVAASEEQALLAHPGVDRRLDERRVAQMFAAGELDSDATFFAAVKEVLPGHAVVVAGGRCAAERYWEAPAGVLRLRDDREYAEAFRAVLAEAVAAQTRAAGPVALLLSGGLDSSGIAATAASLSPRLKAVSWVFDELRSCDERRWIDAVVRHCGLEPLQFPGDGEWPLREFATWRHNPSSPEEDLYRRLTDRALAVACSAGARVVLSGMFGDHLYSGTQGWFWEDPGGRAVARLARTVQSGGARAVLSALRPRRLSPPARRAWLTDRARGLLADPRPWPPSADGALRPGQSRSVLGLLAAHGVAGGTFHTASLGVETRFPYRDRRVVELMLRIPSDQLQRPGLTRPVLRNALAGLLPDDVRERVGKASMRELFLRGVREREAAALTAALRRGTSAWSPYVREEWVAAARPGESAREIHEIVLWLCACFGKWVDRSH